MRDRDLDLVLYGATGFTGRLVARYLVQRTAASQLRWALAGRSEDRLRAVADDVGAPDLPLIVADSTDPSTMATMAERTRVVCTTVGPYAAHGSPVVAACVAAGTDYCDLTGEVHWMRRMIDTHQAAAEQTGARIVHSCGFDSIPSDMGVWYAQQQMQERHGVVAPRVSFRLKAARGTASGGTIASLMAIIEAAAGDPEVRRQMRDPYVLMPDGQRSGPRVNDMVGPAVDRDFGQWVAPFPMAVVNPRIVRRSNALLGYPWGRDFRYDEAMLLGGGPIGAAKAGSVTAGMGMGMAAMAVGPLRSLAGLVLPKPGEGPSEAAQRDGFFDIRLLAEHPDDRAKDLMVRVRGDRDPGYGSTSRMLAESALCLAAGESTVGGGHWTPASALGGALLSRLQEHAGVTFSVLQRLDR